MKRVLLICCFVLISGCAGYPQLRDANREKLSTLDPGMSRGQVVSVMGTDGFMAIKNPYKRESFADWSRPVRGFVLLHRLHCGRPADGHRNDPGDFEKREIYRLRERVSFQDQVDSRNPQT